MKSTFKNPIGIFDSGVGGTSIWKEIQQLLPHENTIYLADSKHAPYGQKSKDEIINLSIKNTEYLLDKNCKLIVVACNTATTNAISHLREKYDVPFIGIEPAIKPASLNTTTNNIGILATQGTLNSQLFATTSNTLNDNINIIEQVGEGLVELIEKGELHSPKMTALLKKHLAEFLKFNIDFLVLGCTHYPYLIPQIQKIIGTKIRIIDSGYAVAKQTKRILEKNNLLNLNRVAGCSNFYSNANPITLAVLLGQHKKASIDYLDF